jgi:hypothetical protein
MYAVLLLTLIGHAPPAVPAPVTAPVTAVTDEWRPYAANPMYEIKGHMQGGVFRYSESRLKAAPKNYGVNLPVHQAVMTQADFEVAGTDKALGHEMAESASKTLPVRDREFHERQSQAIGQDCPRRPKPAPPPVVVPPAVEMGSVLLIGGIILAVMLGFLIIAIKLLILFLIGRWIYRRFILDPPTV